jgi:hypothetical protein
LRSRGKVFSGPAIGLVFVLVVTLAVYFSGLRGPFLFDDPPNLLFPLTDWLAGKQTWQQIVFGNGSGLLGRPVSMLSFLLNAATTGLDPLPFKATNLLIHLACGCLIYALLARLLLRDKQLAPRANVVALLVAALWLLHPMQVSTVLYVVQRMAQLSTMFMLVALLGYVIARARFEIGRHRSGIVWLFVFVPAATLAAVFSKENGALVPLLCGVIELGYFQPRADCHRPRPVKLFFLLTLALPCALALILLSLSHSQRLLGDYEGRLFTLGERLLSEPRALMDYMGALLLPRGPALGIYTDDFAISHGLLDPVGTLPAILGLIALVVIAWKLRAVAPAVFTGFFFYLAGHAMESTIIPLELYFEHRNYLPSAGFLLAVVGFVAWGFARIAARMDHEARTRRQLMIGASLLVALFAFATFARASVWSSWPSLAEQGAREHPQSLRAQLDLATIYQIDGKRDEAQSVFDHMATLPNPAARHVAAIDTVVLQCMADHRASDDAIEKIDGMIGAKLQMPEMLAFENFSDYLQKNDCGNFSKSRLADVMVKAVDSAPQPARVMQLWRTRFNAAKLYLADGYPDKAREQTAMVWMTGSADLPIGIFLANLYFLNNDPTSAHILLKDLGPRLSPRDTHNRLLITELLQHFDGPAKALQPTP